MNAEVKAKWLEALRSGRYQQTSGELCYFMDKDGEGPTYCCLGVLCQLAVDDGLPIEVELVDGTKLFDDASAVLPESVMRWAGLEDKNPSVSAGTSLASINDGGMPFTEIASIIEREL